MKLGTNDISKIMLGGSEIDKIYLGTSQVYSGGDTPTPPAPSYEQQYLTIESTSNNNTIYWRSNYTGLVKTISASTDNGNTWTSYTSSTGGTEITTLNTGDKLLLKGENATYAESWNYQAIFASTSSFITYGNIMSLISGDSFENADTLTGTYTFGGLFSECTGLTSAENLILPATTLASQCYYQMFKNCTSLTTAPELPATTLTYGCYSDMFAYCTSLTVAPELPATALADECYAYMFYGCTSLTAAPELPATTLAEICYSEMFYRCTSLNYIKCLATDISTDSCTESWVYGVASTGTFVKAAITASDWECGANGIPEGWSVEDENGNPETNPCDGWGEQD